MPFYSGLSYGAVSTEADVWLINGTLHVSDFSVSSAESLGASPVSSLFSANLPLYSIRAVRSSEAHGVLFCVFSVNHQFQHLKNP